MPAFAQAFPVWSENSAGILQHIVWTALVAEGHGASLQVCVFSCRGFLALILAELYVALRPVLC